MFDGSPTATSALLTAPQPVSPGVYRISVMVTDSEGRRCEEPESLTLEVCQCDYRDICPNVYPTSIPNPIIGERSGRMGAAAIGLLFLGLLLLLCEYARGMVACARTKHLCSCFRGRAHRVRWARGCADIFRKTQKCLKLTYDLPTIYIYNTAEQVVYVRHIETSSRESKKGEKKAWTVYTLPGMFTVKIMTLSRIAVLSKMSFPSTSLMKF